MILLLLTPPCVAQQTDTATNESGIASPPTPSELEARGAVIGTVYFHVDDVFDLTNPKENNWLFRTANKLHITTKQDVIEDQILFKTGDLFIQRKIEESERILRRNGFLYDATIRPIRYYDNKVDIEVATRDVWTLTGGINYKHQGGQNKSGFEIQDQNVLGQGKSISIQRSIDADRRATLFEYFDPLLTEQRLQMKVGYSSNSDGFRKTFELEQPFFSLDSRWSYGVETLNESSREAIYRDNQIFQRYDHRETSYELFSGYSFGFERNRSERFTFGFASEETENSPNAETDITRSVPASRALAYPWVGFNRIDNHFIKATRIDSMERTEDINLGTTYDIKLGASNTLFGATNNRLILSSFFSSGDRLFGPDNLLLSTLSLTGQLTNTHAENLLLRIQSRLFVPMPTYQVSYARLQFDSGHDLNEDEQLLLGGDSGLRGYPSNYREGNRRFLLTLEQRFYSTWHIWQLFYVGAAAFFDMGSAWQNEARNNRNYETLRDYGFGLRIASSRSGRGQVLHIDLAYPMDRDESIPKRQTIVALESTF